MPSSHDPNNASAACAGCALTSNRRTFLWEAARLAGVAALAAAMPGRAANALPLVASIGGRRGDTVHYPIPSQDGAQIDRDNQVILVRWQKGIYAFSLSCPHQNTALRWDDSRFQCPKHHSKYQPDGTFIDGRATRNMDRFAIKRDGEQVVVDLNAFYKSSEDQTAWTAAVVQVQ